MSLALLAGIVRVTFWGLAVGVAIKYKRIVPAITFLLTTSTSTVFLFSNGGISVPAWLFDYAVLVSVPIAALFFMLILEMCHLTDAGNKRWQLW